MAEKIAIKKNRSAFLRHASSFLKRFHLLLFFIFVAACLAFGVILINTTINESTPSTSDIPTQDASIDETTLNAINSLHQSGDPHTAPSLPDGRINPFAE